MKIQLIAVGSLKGSYIKAGVEDYLGRLKRYTPIEVTEVARENFGQKTPKAKAQQGEGRRILSKVGTGDYVVTLDETGKGFTSKGFSGFLEQVFTSGKRRLTFVIGGAYGLDTETQKRADSTISLSNMTLTHEMARLVFCEQLYRAFTIMRGEPYSH